MARLEDQQVEELHDQLLRWGIAYDPLRDDLLDHLCCMVEYEMNQGQTFSEAVQEALVKFDIYQIQETQEITLHLLTQKQRIMKKVAAITGIIASALAIGGVLFKMMHWPGAEVMLVLGVSLLSVVVLPLMGLIEFKQSNVLRSQYTALIGYISGATLFLGTLFRIMHWPGSSVLIVSGFVVLTFIFIPLYTIKSYQNTDNKMLAIARSAIIISAIAILWGLFP